MRPSDRQRRLHTLVVVEDRGRGTPDAVEILRARRLVVEMPRSGVTRSVRVGRETVLDQVASNEGVSALQKGLHRDVFLRQYGRWLETETDAPVLLVGMVGNREGWLEALYAIYPAGSAEIAQALVPADLENGRRG